MLLGVHLKLIAGYIVFISEFIDFIYRGAVVIAINDVEGPLGVVIPI